MTFYPDSLKAIAVKELLDGGSPTEITKRLRIKNTASLYQWRDSGKYNPPESTNGHTVASNGNSDAGGDADGPATVRFAHTLATPQSPFEAVTESLDRLGSLMVKRNQLIVEMRDVEVAIEAELNPIYAELNINNAAPLHVVPEPQ